MKMTFENELLLEQNMYSSKIKNASSTCLSIYRQILIHPILSTVNF